MSVAVEDRLERILWRKLRLRSGGTVTTDGNPALATVPIVIAGVDFAIPVGVEIQVRRQLVTLAPVREAAAHPLHGT